MSSHSSGHPHLVYPTPPSTASTGRSRRTAGDNHPYTGTPPIIPHLSSSFSPPPTSRVAEPNVMHYPSLSTSSTPSHTSSQPYISSSSLGRAVIPLPSGGSPPVGRASIPSSAHGSAGGPRAQVNFAPAPERRRAHESSARTLGATQSLHPVVPHRHLPASWRTTQKSPSRPRKQHIRSTPCQLLNHVFSSNSVGAHHTLGPPSLHHELLRKARFNSPDGTTTRFACLRWDMRFPPSHSFGRDRCRYSVLHCSNALAPIFTLYRPDYYANTFTIQPSTQLLKLKSSDNTVQRLLNVSPLVIKWERGTVLTVQVLLKKLFEYLNTPLSSVERRRLVHPADDVHLQRTCARRVHDVEMAALRYGQSLPKNLAETYRVDLLGVNYGFYGFELKYDSKTQVELVLSVRSYDTNMAIMRTRD
ncbi:hypothetical protein BDZ89DRAFT_1070495 [Hymenopellis radicata]|nr:hypothetical protein BDZ89DRAFT_1070495 [Hymenopellis radicata]